MNMDEPQLTEEAVETDADAAKSDFNEVSNSAFENKEMEKPMNIDDATVSEVPSTSGDVVSPEDVADNNQAMINQSVNPAEEDAGQAKDITMDELVDESPGESVEQVIFEKPKSQLQSELDNDSLDFTEQSINISQLNVELEHHDDSNDAFNALKESETDALQEPKEEEEEPKDEEQSTAVETEANNEVLGSIATDPVQANELMEVDVEKVSEDKTIESETAGEQAQGKIHDAASVDLDSIDSLGSPESHHNPDNEDIEVVPEGKTISILNVRIDTIYQNFQTMGQQKQQMKVKGWTKTFACWEMRQ